MISLLICDDDKEITDKITTLVNEFQNDNNVNLEIDVRNHSEQVIEESKSYDIAVVDVEMPNTTGLSLAKTIRDNNEDAIIIVITSHLCYLDSAMGIQAFRFLTKPIEEDRFLKNFGEAVKYYKKLFKEVIVEVNGKVSKLKTIDILYIENIKHGANIVTKNAVYKTNKKPAVWEKIIDQPNFFVHSNKSYIVNLQNIVYFDKNTISFTRGKGKEELSVSCISQRKYQDFKKAFLNFAGNLS